MSKHSSSESNGGDAAIATDSPKAKKRKLEVEFEPLRICSIGSVKEIDNKVLRAQHYKLCERFRCKEKLRLALEKRVDELERRQAQDDAVLCLMNRYWNMLDENLQTFLQRFVDELTVDSDLDSKESSNAKHFLRVLSQWSCEEMEEKFKQRVEFSKRAISKLVQAFEQIVSKNAHICAILMGEHDSFHQQANGGEASAEPSSALKTFVSVDDELRSHATEVLRESVRLQKLVTSLQAENHRLNLQSANHDDQINIMESRMENISNEMDDLRYELRKSMLREEKLDHRLAEYIRKENTLQTLQVPILPVGEKKTGSGSVTSAEEEEKELANVTKLKLEELQQELDLQSELAANRLSELQELTERNKVLSADLESCQMKLRYIPAEDVKNSSEYRTLQMSYSSLFEDAKNLRKEIEELNQKMDMERQLSQDQIANMKVDEATTLERMEETVIELDNNLNMVRREYDNLCIEHEHLTAARDQTGPVHEQVLTLMNSFSSQNAQLKKDVSRFKRKWQETMISLSTCQKELEQERRLNNDNYLIIKLDEKPPDPSLVASPRPVPAEPVPVPPPDLSNCGLITGSSTTSPVTPVADEKSFLGVVKKEELVDVTPESGEGPSVEQRPIKQEPKQSPPLPGSKTDQDQQLIKQLTLERNKLKEKIRGMARMDVKEKRKSFSDETRRKLRQLEEQCDKLRRELANAKQEEDGLMAEMESTGQAFEEMQEQNQKLVQQLREKDEVNLKLMSERIRSNQAQKKMKDEKELVDQMIVNLENQLAAKTFLCQKLEEKERAWNESRATFEQELRLRDQANESLKRKAAEFSQAANDLRLRLDRLTSQFNEVQESVAKKASSYEASALKIKRLQEEKNGLKRKLERAKRMEKYENVDELLQEENRQLKESLTCPSCKVNTKNAILTKCYHVFCFDCLKLRYDTRRRKCPKCNAAFGANDFRRVYIE